MNKGESRLSIPLTPRSPSFVTGHSMVVILSPLSVLLLFCCYHVSSLIGAAKTIENKKKYIPQTIKLKGEFWKNWLGWTGG